MDFQAARWLVDGVVPGQAGNDHPTLFPMGAFETGDGRINIAVLTGWERFAEAIGAPELTRDPRFAEFGDRVRNREALREAVEERLRARPTAEWVEILTRADLPCGPILALDEVFDDPQVRHLDLTRRVVHERAGEMDLLRHPVTFSDTPAGVKSPPPLAGRHTREVLGELGYAPGDIDTLVESGAVASTGAD